MDVTTKKELCKQLQTVIKHLDRQRWSFAHITNYPHTPEVLAQNVRDFPYQDEPPIPAPAELQPAQVELEISAMGYRGTHKDLRSKSAPPSVPLPHDGQQAAVAMLGQLMGAFTGMM
eukprot:2069091-Pyramimonas_sp.AAC.1